MARQRSSMLPLLLLLIGGGIAFWKKDAIMDFFKKKTQDAKSEK